MAMTTIEKEIMKGISPIELLEYFKLREGTEDIELNEVVEYIENVKTKYEDLNEGLKIIKTGEKLSQEQIKNRNILKFRQEFHILELNNNNNKQNVKSNNRIKNKNLNNLIQEDSLHQVNTHMRNNIYDKLIDIENDYRYIEIQIENFINQFDEKYKGNYGVLDDKSREKYKNIFMDALVSHVMNNYIKYKAM